MSYPDFSNGSEDPEVIYWLISTNYVWIRRSVLFWITIRVFQGSTVLTGSSSVDSKSNVKTPAKCEGSPIESLEAAFYKSTANKHGPSDSIKKVKTEKSGWRVTACLSTRKRGFFSYSYKYFIGVGFIFFCLCKMFEPVHVWLLEMKMWIYYFILM